MDATPRRYVVTRRTRLRYPGYVTRALLTDSVTGAWIALGDRDIAERVARTLEAGDADPGARGLARYRVVRSSRGRHFVQRVKSAADSAIVGVTYDDELAVKITAVLNRLDPGSVAPARRISAGWF